MNRENKRKQYEKGYYKTHACEESFTCKNCGRLVVPFGAGSDHRNHCPNCLHSLHVDIEPGDRESDCGSLMVGAGKRGVGDHSPLPPLRRAELQPGSGRRQRHEAHEYCHEAPQ